MTENLTKATSAEQPATRQPARADSDEQTHLVDAAPVDVVDPASLRTLCGEAVMQVYNDGRDATCERCTDS